MAPLSQIILNICHQASLDDAKAYKGGKAKHKGPSHTTYPSKASPLFHYQLLKGYATVSQVLCIPDVFPNPNSIPFPHFARTPSPSSSPYFSWMTFFHKASHFKAYLQHHWHMRDLLSKERPLIPRPHFLFFQQTIGYFIKCIFFSKAPPPQSKSLNLHLFF